MGKTMKRITAFVLAMAVLMTTVNWSFVSERTDAEMLDASSTYNTENTGLETDTSRNTEIPVYTLPPKEPAEPSPSPEAGVDAEPAWKASCQTDEVKVTVSAAEGVVPEGTTVKVTPILADKKETQEQYQQVADKLDEKAEGESYDIIGFLAYDITLIDPEENEMEPNGDVKVTMEYIKATLPEAVAPSEENNPNVTVMHFAENAAGEVEEVVDLSRMDSELSDDFKINKIEALQVDDNQAIEEATFVTDSFSTFTVVWKTNVEAVTRTLNVQVVVNREKKELVRTENYAIIDVAHGDSRTAAQLNDTIKGDPLLTGCTFVGMQKGDFNPGGEYIGTISYHAMNVEAYWWYQPLKADGTLGNWTGWIGDTDATVTLVYETAPEFTVVWTANNRRKLNVNIVINGDSTVLHDRQYPDANADGNYKLEVGISGDNRKAAQLAEVIKDDQVLKGCTFVGMQLGNYNPGGEFIGSISYNPTEDTNWWYEPLKADGTLDGGNWQKLPMDTWGDNDNLTVTLVYQTALDVYLVDRQGNQIGQPYSITLNNRDNTTGAQIASDHQLEGYAYLGATLNQYNPANPNWFTNSVSYNVNANCDTRSWCYNTNNGWPHWDGLQYGQNPRIYLVYEKITPKTIHVQAIEAETNEKGENTVIDRFEITVTQTNGTGVSYFNDLMLQRNNGIRDNYKYIGTQPGEYANVPTLEGPNGELIAPTWIYNIAYSYADSYWSYTTTNDANAAYINWIQGDEITVSLIYDKNDNELTPVETLNTSGTGIYMRLLNYSAPGQEILAGDGYLGGQEYFYNGEAGHITQGVVQRVLGDDGYPVTADTGNGNGKAGLSLAPLFAGEYWGDGYANPNNSEKFVQSQGEVDGLFRTDIYEETGYYAYSSFENYAYYDGWEFTLYEELGTPADTDNPSMLYYKRGNFMPFNAIDANDIAILSRNWYNGDGSLRDPKDPESRYGETLYKTQGGNDYWFGMYVEAYFYKPEDGLVENPTTGNMEPMVYQFNGDDDLWIFVDDVLLLDIGGVHDAHDGQIDFATGIISWSDCATGEDPVTDTTTIKQQYKEAGIFPDGTTWDDNKVDEYFDGDTFKDFTTHTMKMFYMERGAGASNLQMSFNLKVIPDETLEVSKQLNGDEENRYAEDVEFAFQLWAQKPDPDLEDRYLDEMEPIAWPAIYKETEGSVDYDESVVIDGITYKNVFYIKPSQVVQFTEFPENREYQIVEIGLKDDKYGDAYFNGNPALVVKDENGNVIGQGAGRAVAGDTPVVTITNTCKTGDFAITKAMKDGQTSTDSFKFKVWVEDPQTGKLEPYVGNYYVNGSETAQRTEDGIISGVKVNDKVVFKALFNGTRFYVDELEYQGKYLTPAKTSTKATTDKLSITGLSGISEVTADGVVEGIADTEEANPVVTLTVTNEYKPSVTVTKQWNDVQDRNRDGIYVGLYELLNINGVMEERYVGKDAALLNADNNWTHTWQYVDAGKTYLVKEFRLAEAGDTTGIISIAGQNYVPVDAGQSVVVSDVKYNVGYTEKQDTTDTNGGAVEAFTVTNTIVWNIVKTGLGDSNQNNRAPLAGAKFTLISDANVRYEGVSRAGDGVVEWKQGDTSVTVLPAGSYTLEEVQAPSGYVLNTDDWTITVSDQGVPSITTGATELVGSIDAQSHELVFDFHNSPMYDLPSGGSFGIFGYVAGGIIIMLAAVILVFKSSGKRSILEK